MAKDLLLEIGMEEIPARFIRAAMDQLRDKTAEWLKEMRIDFQEIRSYATPRRIAVLARGVSEKQKDLQEEMKGPSKKIALDENGQWSKAAQGFARGQGAELDQLFFKELNGVEYVYAVKNSIGVETRTLLPQGFTAVIGAMSFPKNMRWGYHELKFVRPIRWLTALFGSDIVEFILAGVPAGRTTKGHRFLGSETAIKSAGNYAEALRHQHVIADCEERKSMILQQIGELSQEKGWQISIPDDLLEEVLFLVETPTVLYGSFEPDFLNIPQEVLITSMREHQRYFPVLDGEGKLLPHFVTVRNGDSRSLDTIARGNEKVLRARLSDARFFYSEDQKMPISKALEKLESIVFHEELGTVGDKVRRIGAISRQLAEALGLNEQEKTDIVRAAAICKFDLVTQMVYEFPELQGIMGQDYAKKAGEREQVADAVFEHYQPRFAGDDSPASVTGAIVSVADKIDSIAGCFSIGIIPTGSADPYALRRQASGIVQILLERLPLKLSDVFDAALRTHAERGTKRNGKEILRDLYDFFALRMKNVMNEDVRYDVVDAVLASGFDDVSSTLRKGKVLMDRLNEEEKMKTAIESFNRVANLADKAGEERIDTSCFQEAAEHELYRAWQTMHGAYEQQMSAGGEDQAYDTLAGLEAPITEYFNRVMVMAEDERLRQTRLALLKAVSDDIAQYADFRKLVL